MSREIPPLRPCKGHRGAVAQGFLPAFYPCCRGLPQRHLLHGVGSSCRFGRQWYAIVAFGTSGFVCLVTLVCGEANRCSVTIAVWLVTRNAAVSLPIRLKAISRRRGRTRPASRVMKALTVLLAMPRCRRMRRCMPRCSISCSPMWRRAGRRCRRSASISRRSGIPARIEFNAARITLDGKVSAVRGSQLLQLDSQRRRVSRAEKQVDKAEQECQWRQVHGKRRRLANLKFRLSGLEADIAAGRVRLCFGSQKLWRKQYDLKANGYACHEEWLRDWQDARSDEFFVVGSRDETAGCQLCVASVNDDGTLTLRLRMPDGLAGRHGKYLVVPNVRFASGHDVVLAALGSNTEYAVYRRREHGEKEARATVSGSSHQLPFQAGRKGWRVFATTELPEVEVTTDRRRGAVGVDLNADHLAVVETDASWQLRESVAGAAGDLRQEPPSGGGSHRRRGGGCGGVRPGSRASPSSSRSWTSGRRRPPWRASPVVTAGCCPVSATARSRRTSSPVVIVREWRYIRSTRPTVPSLAG